MPTQSNTPERQQLINQKARPSKAEDLVLAVTVFGGFCVGVLLAFTSVRHAIPALFFATGLGALVFRWLGGVEGSVFQYGVVRIGGTIGTIMCVWFVLNSTFENQDATQKDLLTREHEVQRRIDSLNGLTSSLAGTWKWQYAAKPGKKPIWSIFTFTATARDNVYSVVGKVRGGESGDILMDVKSGFSTRTWNGRVGFEFQVFDYILNRDIIWRTPPGQELIPGTSYSGAFQVSKEGSNNVFDPDMWGITLTRQ